MKRETQDCCQSLYRGEGQCLAYSAKHDENTGQQLRSQMQMADGMSVRKGEFWTLEGERKAFKTPSGWSGINRTGKKLKEVNIQTHQWKKKNQVGWQGTYIGKIYMWDIFRQGSPPIKISFGRNPQFWRPQGQKYWGKLEVHFRKVETSNLTKSGRSRSADWQIRGMRPELTG